MQQLKLPPKEDLEFRIDTDEDEEDDCEIDGNGTISEASNNSNQQNEDVIKEEFVDSDEEEVKEAVKIEEVSSNPYAEVNLSRDKGDTVWLKDFELTYSRKDVKWPNALQHVSLF